MHDDLLTSFEFVVAYVREGVAVVHRWCVMIASWLRIHTRRNAPWMCPLALFVFRIYRAVWPRDVLRMSRAMTARMWSSIACTSQTFALDLRSRSKESTRMSARSERLSQISRETAGPTSTHGA